MLPVRHVKRNLPDGIIVYPVTPFSPLVYQARYVALFGSEGEPPVTGITVRNYTRAGQSVNGVNRGPVIGEAATRATDGISHRSPLLFPGWPAPAARDGLG